VHRYTVRASIGVSTAMNLPLAQLWNPSSTRRIEVVEFWVFDNDADSIAGFTWTISRSSARGATPTATVTPDADNSHDADSVPPSGAVLELAPFATPPTLATPPLSALAYKALSAGAARPDGGIVYYPSSGDFLSEDRPVVVPPGTGLVLAMTGGTSSMGNPREITVGFED
jgi:hypothetical protein